MYNSIYGFTLQAQANSIYMHVFIILLANHGVDNFDVPYTVLCCVTFGWAFLYGSSISGCPCVGDQRPNVTPADIVFIIEERPHQTYKREGSNLLYTHRLPLIDALCGTSFTLQTLDDRRLPVSVQSTMSPNSVKVSILVLCCACLISLLIFIVQSLSLGLL